MHTYIHGIHTWHTDMHPSIPTYTLAKEAPSLSGPRRIGRLMAPSDAATRPDPSDAPSVLTEETENEPPHKKQKPAPALTTGKAAAPAKAAAEPGGRTEKKAAKEKKPAAGCEEKKAAKLQKEEEKKHAKLQKQKRQEEKKQAKLLQVVLERQLHKHRWTRRNLNHRLMYWNT